MAESNVELKVSADISGFAKSMRSVAEAFAKTFIDMAHSMEKLIESLEEMEKNMDKIHVYKDEADEWRWKRVAPNGEIVADSGEGYESETGATEAANREATGTGALVILDSQT